jgi:WD40 repeat protein/DNA-binding SARP family transcriptional activator
MEFRVLGPVEVLAGDGPLPLGGPKQRAVLAHLILAANRGVTAERLIDEVWGEEPPQAVKSSLESYVSRLRSALGSAGRIESAAGAYRLHTEPHEIDLARFEFLLTEARGLAGDDPAAALLVFQEALALWRGRPFGDLADHPSFVPEVTRLEGLRLAAIEDRLDVELVLGRHGEVIPEVETLLREEPLRERLWRQLILALYRSGRQADALAAFERARVMLADELGIDPSPELRRLQERVLRQDPALELESERLRGYRLLERLGEGAYGAVHRAFQPEVGREVAVKIIRPELANHPDFIRRFTVEAQLVARLEHPHIVPLYDYWREPDGAYLVMRYLRGGSLRTALTDGPLDPARAAQLAQQVAQALTVAHRQGVVHRDVKPANILFDEDGNAYLSDFGIAKDLATSAPSASDRSTSDLAYYLSPEEARGEPVTPRSDVYGLGMVLFESLAGRHPFADAPPDSLPELHARQPLPSVRSLREDLPPALDEVLGRATAKDPDDRFPDARAFAAGLRDALEAAPASIAVAAPELRNPYKGLRPFLEADAGDFFGRGRTVRRVLDRLAEEGERFLAVVGPSGSGKSSVVRAGVVPALRGGALPGSDRWFVAEMTPGADPFGSLARALVRVAPRRMSDLARRLREGDDALVRVAEELLPAADGELLLVLDQLEEVFTLVDDEVDRSRFLEAIRVAAISPGSRVRIVATLRADLFDRPLAVPGFGELLAARNEAIPPLGVEELRESVTGPAEAVGVTVEPELTAEIVAEITERPGALPLLEYALTEVFERRDGPAMTLEAYRAVGGITGALTRRAEAVHGRLNEAGRDATRQLFLRLVTLGEDGAADTRRRALRSELASLHPEPAVMDAAVDAFAARRLLSFDRDPVTRGPTVEVAHEALFDRWERLRRWIDEAREDLRAHGRLSGAARDWVDASREPSFLLSGSRLEQAEASIAASGLALSAEERELLDASIADRDRAAAREEKRAERERALERRSLTRTRALAAVLAAGLVLATVLSAFALRQRGRAEQESRVARARELAAAAVANLDVDAERSILLALEAIETTREQGGSVLPEAEEALHRAIGASRIERVVPGLGGLVDWSPEGSLFVSEGPEESGMVDVRDARTGRRVRRWHGHGVDVNDIAFSPDGSMLATTGDDGALRVWDPSTGRQVAEVEGDGQVWGPAFHPDGARVAAAWADEGTVRVLDVLEDRTVVEFAAPAVIDTAFSPDGRQIGISVTDDPRVFIVDAEDGRLQMELAGHDWPVNDVDWSPDGRWISTASGDLTTRVWNAADGTPRSTLSGHTGMVINADWNPDSQSLVTGSGDGTARVWRIDDGGGRHELTLSAHETRSGLGGVAFSPDGNRVVTGDAEITAARIWNVGPRGDAEWANLPGDPTGLSAVDFAPSGEVVASTGEEAVIWQPGGRKVVRRLATAGQRIFNVDVSPDGRWIVTSGGGKANVWDARTGALRFGVPAAELGAASWSRSGSLLALAGQSGSVPIVDQSGRAVGTVRQGVGFDVKGVALSPDGRLVAASVYPEGRANPTLPHVSMWDWRGRQEVRRIWTAAEGIAFDPSGERLVTSHLGGLPTVWEARTGRELVTLPGHSGQVFDAAFSPDGSTIATAGSDATVRIWDAATGRQRVVLRGHDGAVTKVRFSADGSRLVSGGGDDVVRVWALDLDDLMVLANAELTRGLTAEECRTFLHLQRCPRP